MEFNDNSNLLFPEPNAYIQKCGCEKERPKKIIFQEPYENVPNFYLDNNFKKGSCSCIPKQKGENNCDCNNPSNHSNFPNLYPDNCSNFWEKNSDNLSHQEEKENCKDYGQNRNFNPQSSDFNSQHPTEFDSERNDENLHNQHGNSNSNFPQFNLNNLLSMFGGGGTGLSNLVPLLSGLGSGGGNSGGFNLSNLLSGLTNSANAQNNNSSSNSTNSNLDLTNLVKMFSSSGGLGNILNLFKGNKKSTIEANKNKIKSTDFLIKDYKRVE